MSDVTLVSPPAQHIPRPDLLGAHPALSLNARNRKSYQMGSEEVHALLASPSHSEVEYIA